MSVTRITWTYGIAGPCIFCGRQAKRTVNIEAAEEGEAQRRADRAEQNIAHRKCAGY